MKLKDLRVIKKDKVKDYIYCCMRTLKEEKDLKKLVRIYYIATGAVFFSRRFKLDYDRRNGSL